MGRGSGACPTEVHCRRWHMRDGSVRMNPGYQNPECVRPEGPTDPELGVLVLRTPERKPIAVLANLALHYVGGGPATWISADYFGAFGDALRRCAGADFVAAMANGCFGDINNCNFARPAPTQPYPYANVERVANVAAAEAWRVWSTLREDDFASDVCLGARLEEVRFEARMPTDEELADARKRLDGPEDPKDIDWAYARELVMLLDMPSAWDVPIHALRIGDLGITGLPGEVFARIGLGIKQASPFGQNMVIGLANGSVGYVGTDDAIRRGGYETRLCRHVRTPLGTADLWTETATRLLTELKEA
jgi:neutral ceramidase